MKRRKQEVMNCNIDIDRLLVKLLMIHGFKCIKDMAKFSVSLDKEFMNWANTEVFDEMVVFINYAHPNNSKCMHFVSTKEKVIKSHILQIKKNDWTHVIHFPRVKDALCLQLALSICKVGVLYTQVVCVDDYSFVEEIQPCKKAGCHEHLVKVEHWGDYKQCDFVVNVKYL